MADKGNTEKKQKISIIGGGQSAAMMLHFLATKLGSNPLIKPSDIEVEVYDARKAIAGEIDFQGQVWNPNNVLPCHTLNTYFGDDSNFNDFLEMAIKEHPGFASAVESGMGHHGEVSRSLYSAYLHRISMSSLQRLDELGVIVTQKPEQQVVSIEPKGDMEFILTTNKGEKVRTDYAVLATGHWQGNAKDREGVYNSPWPAPKFQNEDLNRPIAVMGTSLSAVDAAMTLAHYAGSFRRNKDGKLTFTPYADNKDFHIDAYSRHGMLPNVLGPVTDDYGEADPTRHIAYKYVRGEKVADIDATFRNLRDTFLAKYPGHGASSGERALLEKCDTLKQLVDGAYDYYAKQDAATLLSAQLKQAKHEFEHEEDPVIQTFLRAQAHTLEMANMMSLAEDQDYFYKEVRSLFAKHAYGMVVQNAEQIQALMDAGCLDVHALGRESFVSTDSGRPGAEIRYTDKQGVEQRRHYDLIVRAQGDEPQKLKHSSPLMKQLFESGLASTHRVPYADQQRGRREHDAQQEGMPKDVVKIDGTYYKDFGGIALGAGRSLHNGKEHVHGMYGVGPVHYLQTPLLQGVAPIMISSELVTQDIISDIMAKKMMDKLFPGAMDEPEPPVPPVQQEKISEPKPCCFRSMDGQYAVFIMQPGTPEQIQYLTRDRIATQTGIPFDKIFCMEDDRVSKEMLAAFDIQHPIRGVSM